MLVNLDPFGRLGNRLFLDAHLSAFCWKHGFELQNFAMKGPRVDLPRAFTGRRQGLLRLQSWLPGSHHFRYWDEQNLDFDHQTVPALEDPLSRGETVFFHAWKFRGFESVQRFHDRLVEKYRPREAITRRGEELVAPLRSQGLVVGVHVRWEDYRGTEHFLSLDQFRQRMSILKQQKASQGGTFLVFSNETLTETDFLGLPVVLTHGTPAEDLYTMSLCDFLIGPPSTFSGWASFLGRVPLLTLSAQNSEPRWEDFRVVEG